jgi:hypothetical protein
MNWLGAVLTWVLILAFTAAIGLPSQWLFFANEGSRIWDIVWRWPVLWVLYFLVGHSLGEHAARLISRWGAGQRKMF